jgi:hypothetical protein
VSKAFSISRKMVTLDSMATRSTSFRRAHESETASGDWFWLLAVSQGLNITVKLCIFVSKFEEETGLSEESSEIYCAKHVAIQI